MYQASSAVYILVLRETHVIREELVRAWCQSAASSYVANTSNTLIRRSARGNMFRIFLFSALFSYEFIRDKCWLSLSS